jgi:nitrate reductase NapAB chaperone NapD
MADKTEWKLTGTILTTPPIPLTALVSELKEIIQKETNMPAPKQKLVIVNDTGMPIVLKNNLSLAYYNLTKERIVSLGLKGRGGKK